tara:strand:+ start:146 stop:334 length:189 start_codon:yes stop_codon:yes gene_type:complete
MDKITFDHFVDLLEKKDFKKKLVKKLNKNIDIPIIDEKTESKILDKIYGVIVDTIKKIDLED